MAADLHCHTKMSDGSVGIDELILLAKNKGLNKIAVTDHDTFAGSVRAKVFGDRHGVEVIPGIEFSTYDYARNRKAHILCYYCNHPDRLQGICKKTGENRKHAAAIMIQKVMRFYPISPEFVVRRAQGSTNIYKQHIMHALIDAGYADEFFGSVFQKLFHPKTGLAYSSVEYPDVHEVIAQIHGAGGVAVMAHPGEYNGMELLEELASHGEIDGVEVWHPRNLEEKIPSYMEIAEKYHLVMTGGTDFHGMYTSVRRPIGTFTTPDDQLEQLKKRKPKG